MNISKYQSHILEVLKDKHHCTLDEITAQTGADFSTVYRNMQKLLKLGVVRKISIDKKATVYELSHCKKDHFVCMSCNSVEPILIPREFVKQKKVSDIIVRGTCAMCENTTNK